MAQTDLYVILKQFALKNNSAYINISDFLDFLKKYAAHWVQEGQAEWAVWTAKAEKKFWAEITHLAENNRCVLVPNTDEDLIYMPFFILDVLRDTYQNIEKAADIPFPDEDRLKIKIPDGQARAVPLSTDMGIFFEEMNDTGGQPGEEGADSQPPAESQPAADPPPQEDGREYLVKLVFPDTYGSALIPSNLIPRRLIETAFFKLRTYLYSHGNKEYMLHKLSPYMPGREKYVIDVLNQLQIQPAECFRNLESSGDFPSLFWTCFCSLVKSDIKKKAENAPLFAEDVAAIQSAYIIEVCNVFYKEKAAKKKGVELAFRNLDLHLDKPPFYYTLDDIIKFTDDKGEPLLKLYSRKELQDFIVKRTTESKKSELPDWLILQGRKGEHWYIKKNKYLPLCTKMLIGIRPHIRKEIVDRWLKLMKDFRKEPAMEKDDEYERLLAAYTMSINPALMALLEDPKLQLVYSEMEKAQATIPPASRIFKAGKLLPLSTLYAYRRKEMVSDIKFMLPFWYMIPILSHIIAFFKRRGNKRPQGKRGEAGLGAAPAFETQGTGGRTIQNAVRSIEAALVPSDFTPDEYLAELEDRWSRVLDEKSRQNLVNDVRSLVRDNLRYAVKIHKTTQLSQENLGEIADSLIASSSALQRLGGRQALRLYMQLYMVKMLAVYR